MKKKKKNKLLIYFFVLIAFICIGTLFYIKRNFSFNGNPLAQILFHVLVQIDGANPTFIKGIVFQCLIIPLICTIFVMCFLYSDIRLLKRIQNTKILVFIKKYALILSFVLMFILLISLCRTLGVSEYIGKYTKSSTLYEDEYVDPSKVEFSFPNKKRNLIYILLESVETSDYSIAQGGAFNDCYIPELYEIAKNNITFNDNKGFKVAPNTGWTIAAMIGQSAGIPLDIPIDGNDFVTSNKFLPGAYTLGDILGNNGYKNVLLLGSDAVFGGRLFYYQKHGNYEIHDYNWALNSGLVKQEDYVWWGYEDYKLFEFAKRDLLKLEEEQPFNLTLLTVDTHHNDGYVCEYCKDDFDEQLGNVYACSSRQICEFINWCKNQDFYQNTTIVIAGDHCSMDANFSNILSEYDRSVYYTIINPSENCKPTANREMCTFDMYPTIVSSLGIEYKENRLGLGTNLFSNEKTLIEKYGIQSFFSQVSNNSLYYINHILYGFD